VGERGNLTIDKLSDNPMQLTRMFSVRHGATDLGQRPSVSPLNVLAVGNVDRGWLVALVWARAEGEINMLGRFGTIISWCSLAIALVCWIAAVAIFTAIITGKLSDSNAWIAMMFFAVGCISWLVGRGAKYVLDDIDEV
jgi:hypothetical protein